MNRERERERIARERERENDFLFINEGNGICTRLFYIQPSGKNNNKNNRKQKL